MSVLAIIAALVLEQWRPLGDRRMALRALVGWARWFERTLNAGEARHGAISWVLAVAPVCLLAIGAQYLTSAASPFLALLFNVAVLYLTLGFRQFSHYFTAIQAAMREGNLDLARQVIGTWRGEVIQVESREELIRLTIESALLASHRHVFGVLFWYLLLPGPAGALLYRLSFFLSRRWRKQGKFGQFSGRIFDLLEWPAVRLTAASFAVVGDFEDAVYCWRTQAPGWPDLNEGIVLAAGAGAMGVRLGASLEQYGEIESRPELGVGELANIPFLDSVVGLLWRALVLWIFVAVLLAVASAFG